MKQPPKRTGAGPAPDRQTAPPARVPSTGPNPSLRRLLRALQDSSGQTLVEMAVVLPTFLLLVLGFMQFAIVLFGYENATFACETAARYASLHSSTSLSPDTTASVTAVTQTYLWTPANASTVTVAWSPSNTIGSTVTVSVNVTYRIAIPFSSLTSATMTTSAKRTIMR